MLSHFLKRACGNGRETQLLQTMLRCQKVPPMQRLQRRTFITMIPGGEPSGGEDDAKTKSGDKESMWKTAASKAMETAGIMAATMLVLAVAGLTYHNGYKWRADSKMHNAFHDGDAAAELKMHSVLNFEDADEDVQWVHRPQQEQIDEIISGKTRGRYYLLIGEKGTGKTSLILEAMRKIGGRSCTFVDGHSDPEIFRIRLGKALNFEFHEDYIGAMFSLRGPRDTTALLDIERAFNVLEQVAVKYVHQYSRPLVLVIDSAHLIRDDEDGKDLVELLQQKAESLSGSGLCTMIFNSDDYWLYERLKKLATRLEVITIRDFTKEQSIGALKSSRAKFNLPDITDDQAAAVYERIGGRPQHLAHIASHENMSDACDNLIRKEHTWFLNQCGLLGEEMDDDVMESGKFSTSAMLLARALAKMDKENPQKNDNGDHVLPSLPLWKARQIMTRPDYIQEYDNLNIFTIDSNSMVRPDSYPMMQAFRTITSEEGFDDLLEETCDRVAAIESLGRTRELVAKDLVLGAKYNVRNGQVSIQQP